MLTISYDQFHLDFVNYRNIINLLKVCDKLNIRNDIQIAILNNTDLSKIIDPIKNFLYKTDVKIYPVYPIGRAKDLNSDNIIKYDLNSTLRCGKGNSFEIEYDGSINPCCSPYAKYINFNLPNIYDSSIINIFDKLEKHIVLMYLRNKGFYPFIKIAKNNIPNSLVSSCELCYLLFSNNKYINYIPDVYKDMEKYK